MYTPRTHHDLQLSTPQNNDSDRLHVTHVLIITYIIPAARHAARFSIPRVRETLIDTALLLMGPWPDGLHYPAAASESHAFGGEEPAAPSPQDHNCCPSMLPGRRGGRRRTSGLPLFFALARRLAIVNPSRRPRAIVFSPSLSSSRLGRCGFPPRQPSPPV